MAVASSYIISITSDITLRDLTFTYLTELLKKENIQQKT
jgi:hypothetical protein